MFGIMHKKELLESITTLREEWRQAREKKLLRKSELLAQGHDMGSVRHDRLYRDFKKLQHRFSVRINHLERTMNRKSSREKEQ